MTVSQNLSVRTNGFLHYLQDSVKAYDIDLEDRGSKNLHKVLDGLGSPHPSVKKTGDALFPPD